MGDRDVKLRRKEIKQLLFDQIEATVTDLTKDGKALTLDQLLQVAEAFAWTAAPHQPHGGRADG